MAPSAAAASGRRPRRRADAAPHCCHVGIADDSGASYGDQCWLARALILHGGTRSALVARKCCVVGGGEYRASPVGAEGQ